MAEDVKIVAPALPYAPKDYEEVYFNQFNAILRLYFNQLDTVVRDASLHEKSDAVGWFLS
jgi:hypothetical protein